MSSGESTLKTIFVAVMIALIAGGSAPWWWKSTFGGTNGNGNGKTVAVKPPIEEKKQPPDNSPRCHERTVNVNQYSISTNSSNSSIEAGDSEIDSDDWTSVKVSYRVEKINGDRELELVLDWHAQERNSNKSKGDTRIASSKRFLLLQADVSCPESKILNINGLVKRASKEKYYRGEVHNFISFPDFGSLRNIKVMFDGSGRKDHKVQALDAKLNSFSVRMSASSR